jgi:TorA maturation chaperone TorD
MQTLNPVSDSLAIDLARECLYRFLAAALADPRAASSSLLLDANNQRLAQEATALLREEAGPIPLGFGELPAKHLCIKDLLENTHQPVSALQAEYDRVFGLVLPRECPPYETEYQASAEPFFRSQELADIAGFYRAFGLETSLAMPERPDHVSLELEFMAFLIMKKRLAVMASGAGLEGAEHVAICEEAQRNFLRDHLAWWVPSFARGLERKAGGGLYAAAARVLAALIPAERARFMLPAPKLPVQPAPIERPEEQSGCAICPMLSRLGHP